MAQQCRDKDIRITPTAGRVTVTFAGRVIADTTAALDLDEPGAPLRVYVPLADVDRSVLVASNAHTTCPYKGVASYYSLTAGKETAPDAVWYYADPCPLVAPIRDHVAFWGDKVRYDRAAG